MKIGLVIILTIIKESIALLLLKMTQLINLKESNEFQNFCNLIKIFS